MSDSVRPHGWQPTRLPRPWDSPGKNTGVGCHFFLQCMKVNNESESLSRIQLFATPWTAAYRVPPSMGFSRQEYWMGCHCPLQPTLFTAIHFLFLLFCSSLLPLFYLSSSLCTSTHFSPSPCNVCIISACRLALTQAFRIGLEVLAKLVGAH